MLKLIFAAHVVFASPRAAAVACPDVVALAGRGEGVPKLWGWAGTGQLRRSWWAKSHFKGLQEFQELLFVGKGQAGLCFLAKVA